MLFDDTFIQDLPDNPPVAISKIIAEYEAVRIAHSRTDSWTDAEYQAALETRALLIALAQRWDIALSLPPVSGNLGRDCKNIMESLLALNASAAAEIGKQEADRVGTHYAMAVGVHFACEFSDGDLNRIQVLINELREYLSNTTEFAAEHRQRLLARLEKLQQELHKRVSNLDRIWGFIGDAGVVIGKLGKEAEPFVRRIREIVEIAWRTQARAEELPSGFALPPLLQDAGKNAPPSSSDTSGSSTSD